MKDLVNNCPLSAFRQNSKEIDEETEDENEVEIKFDTSRTPTWDTVFTEEEIMLPDSEKRKPEHIVDYLFRKVVHDLDSKYYLEDMINEYDKLKSTNHQLLRLLPIGRVSFSSFLIDEFVLIKNDEKKRSDFFRIALTIHKHLQCISIDFLEEHIVDITLGELNLFKWSLGISYKTAFKLCEPLYNKITEDKDKKNKIDFVLDQVANPQQMIDMFIEVWPTEQWRISLFEKILNRIDPILNDHLMIYDRLGYINKYSELIGRSEVLKIFGVWTIKYFFPDNFDKLSLHDIDNYFTELVKKIFKRTTIICASDEGKEPKMSVLADDYTPSEQDGRIICDLLLSLIDMSVDQKLIDRCLYYTILLFFTGKFDRINSLGYYLDHILMYRPKIEKVKSKFAKLFCTCSVTTGLFGIFGGHFPESCPCDRDFVTMKSSIIDNFKLYVVWCSEKFFKNYKKDGITTPTALFLITKILTNIFVTKSETPIKVSHKLVLGQSSYSVHDQVPTPLMLYKQAKIEKYVADKSHDKILSLVWNSVKMKHKNFSFVDQLDNSVHFVDIPQPISSEESMQLHTSFKGILKEYFGGNLHEESYSNLFGTGTSTTNTNNEGRDSSETKNGEIKSSENSETGETDTNNNRLVLNSIEILTQHHEQFVKLITLDNIISDKPINKVVMEDEEKNHKVSLKDFKDIVKSLKELEFSTMLTSKKSRKRKLESDGNSKLDRYLGEDVCPWICSKHSGKIYYGPSEHLSKTVYFTDKNDLTDEVPKIQPHLIEDVDIDNIAQHLIDLICISEEISKSELDTEIMIDLSDLNYKELLELMSRFYSSVYSIGPGYIRLIKSFQTPILKAFNDTLTTIMPKDETSNKKSNDFVACVRKAKPFIEGIAFKYDMFSLWFYLKTFDEYTHSNSTPI